MTDTLKIVIFYGGDEATEPRDALLNWLRKPQTATILGKKIETRKVSDEIPNSGYTVDQRVEEAIEWADKAIMLFTPDSRSEYGAPNLLEEFGRWRSKKGGKTMIVIRHQAVEKIHTNAAGLIYIGYKDDVVKECGEKLLMFLQEEITAEDVSLQVTINHKKYRLTQRTVIAKTTAEDTPFMVPQLPLQGVVGRDDALTSIYKLLQLDQPQQRDISPVALHGLGGIGKTTLAASLGRLDGLLEWFPDGILWTALGPNPTLRLLLDGWGKALGVDLLPEQDEAACRDRLRNILHYRRVLLIIDDVWDVNHGRYFTVAGPQCRTLLTTREPPIAYELATKQRSLRVDVLKPEAALELLRRLAPEVVTQDAKNAQRLCERLEYLPLALTLAGRLLAVEAEVPARMLRILEELIDEEKGKSRLTLEQSEGRLGLGKDETVSLQAILGMSVNRLEQIDKERFAMLAVFGGDPLTWEIKATKYVWECSIEDAEDTMARLIGRGLVAPRETRYWMHALLADYAEMLMEDMDL